MHVRVDPDALSLFAKRRTTTNGRDSCDGMSHTVPSFEALHWRHTIFRVSLV